MHIDSCQCLILPLKLKHLGLRWHPCFYAIHHHSVLKKQQNKE